MSFLLDIIYMGLKSLWKFSRFAVILIIIFVGEIFALLNWKEETIRNYFSTSDLKITEVEMLPKEDGLAFLVTIQNDGSLGSSRLPGLKLYCDEESFYLEDEDIYVDTVGEDEYTYIRSSIPGKTKVTAVYHTSEYFYMEDYKEAKNISLCISEYDTMEAEEYRLR